MLFTLGKLNIDFIEDVDELRRLIDEYEKLETAIQNSVHYRLLAGKTQTLGKGKGVTRKERSRIAHTNTIANSVCKPLVGEIYDKILESNPSFNESNELKEIFQLNRELAIRKSVCMAKAHDIGHVAFGHEGERAINNYFEGIDPNDVMQILREHREVFGDVYETEQGHISQEIASHNRAGKAVSFEHNELSAILLNQIITNNGINLPAKEISDLTLGVLAHSTSRVRKYELIKGNLPAQTVRAGDKVEYRNADFDELRDLIAMDPDMPIDIIQYLEMPLADRIKKTNQELVDEAIRKGRIWEARTGLWETEPVMQRLSLFRKAYEDAIFMYDSSYSYRLLTEELFPRLSNPDELKKFYDEHPGVDVFYPEEKVREIYQKSQDLEKRAQSGETPSLEDDELSDEIWDDTVPFKSVLQGENSERIYSIYTKVLDYYYRHPEQIPEETEVHVSPIDYRKSETLTYRLNPNYKSNMQRTLEYVSLLDDAAMMRRYYELVNERIEKGPDYGIKPVTADEMRIAISDSYRSSVKKFKQTVSTYTAEEAEKIYIQNGNTFYKKGLTEKGREVYERFYKARFAEYAEDKRLLEKMIEADRAKGITTEDDIEEFDGYVIDVELPERFADTGTISGEMAEIDETPRIPGIAEGKSARRIPSMMGTPTQIVIKGPTFKDASATKKTPTTVENRRYSVQKKNGFAKLIGRFGLALTDLGERLQKEEEARRQASNVPNKDTGRDVSKEPSKEDKSKEQKEGHTGYGED